jgi:hypothetical protein
VAHVRQKPASTRFSTQKHIAKEMQGWQTLHIQDRWVAVAACRHSNEDVHMMGEALWVHNNHGFDSKSAGDCKQE